MNHDEKIHAAWQRSARGLAKRPELGKVARSVTARLTEGLTCAIEAEGFRLSADMPEIAGGNEAGPVPSLYVEAALVSCLAIGYRMCFAARDVPPVQDIQVGVTAAFDVRGLYGVDDVSPGI